MFDISSWNGDLSSLVLNDDELKSLRLSDPIKFGELLCSMKLHLPEIKVSEMASSVLVSPAHVSRYLNLGQWPAHLKHLYYVNRDLISNNNLLKGNIAARPGRFADDEISLKELIAKKKLRTLNPVQYVERNTTSLDASTEDSTTDTMSMSIEISSSIADRDPQNADSEPPNAQELNLCVSIGNDNKGTLQPEVPTTDNQAIDVASSNISGPDLPPSDQSMYLAMPSITYHLSNDQSSSFNVVFPEASYSASLTISHANPTRPPEESQNGEDITCTSTATSTLDHAKCAEPTKPAPSSHLPMYGNLQLSIPSTLSAESIEDDASEEFIRSIGNMSSAISEMEASSEVSCAAIHTPPVDTPVRENPKFNTDTSDEGTEAAPSIASSIEEGHTPEQTVATSHVEFARWQHALILTGIFACIVLFVSYLVDQSVYFWNLAEDKDALKHALIAELIMVVAAVCTVFAPGVFAKIVSWLIVAMMTTGVSLFMYAGIDGDLGRKTEGMQGLKQEQALIVQSIEDLRGVLQDSPANMVSKRLATQKQIREEQERLSQLNEKISRRQNVKNSTDMMKLGYASLLRIIVMIVNTYLIHIFLVMWRSARVYEPVRRSRR